MILEKELTDYLKKHALNSNRKSRNIELIKYYYGFGNDIWPTLEDVQNYFSDTGIGSRERVRQIINANFRDRGNQNELKAAIKCSELLKNNDYIFASQFETLLKINGLIHEDINIRGILNLLHDINLCESYDIYTPGLDKATRSQLGKFQDFLIVRKDKLPNIKKLVQQIKSFPARLGVAKLDYVLRKFSGSKELIYNLVVNLPGSWMCKNTDGIWYNFENRDNTLFNHIEKLYSVVKEVRVDILAETLFNSLHQRVHEHEYPPVEIIRQYLSMSSFIEIVGDFARFNGNISKNLTSIEADMYSYLENREYATLVDLKGYLRSKGYGLALINKNMFNSPLVYIDKSKGRQHYKYKFPGSFSSGNRDIGEEEKRYYAFRKRLHKIEEDGTDETRESKRRREQAILQEWIFKDKEVEYCATCGRLFYKSSLVTAHKKKRAFCSENERLDPYVVMPLCRFGCDYLYEEEFISIIKGEVVVNYKRNDGFEKTILKFLNGRKVADRWLKGSESYFQRSL